MPVEQTGGVGIGDWINTHPGASVAIAAGLAILVGGFFLKPKPVTGEPVTPGDLSGLATDAAGNHIIYRDVADQFITTSIVESTTNSISGSYNTSTSTSTTTTNPPPPPVVNPPGGNEYPPPAQHPAGYEGVLGPGIAFVPGSNYSLYRKDGQTFKLVIPGGSQIFPGPVGRVWVRLPNGQQVLLTSGAGSPHTSTQPYTGNDIYGVRA